MRKYLPTLADLLDRISILLLKHRRIDSAELKATYLQELSDCVHDVQEIINETNLKVDASFLLATLILSQSNAEIWDNEKNIRNGIADGNDLSRSHSCNGIRCRAKNILQAAIGGRLDKKLDVIAHDVGFPFFDNQGDEI